MGLLTTNTPQGPMSVDPRLAEALGVNAPAQIPEGLSQLLNPNIQKLPPLPSTESPIDARSLLLTKLGLGLMQAPRPGQSTAGVVAQATGGALDAFQSAKQAESQRAIEQRKLVGAENANAASQAANASQAVSSLSQARLNARRIEESKINEQVIQANIEEAKEKVLKARYDNNVDAAIDPEELAKMKLALEKQRLETLRAQQAAAQASRSASERVGEQAGQATRFRETIANPKTSDEARRFAQQALHGPGSLGASQQLADSFLSSWKAANPSKANESPEAYNQRAATALNGFLERSTINELLKAAVTLSAESSPPISLEEAMRRLLALRSQAISPGQNPHRETREEALAKLRASGLPKDVQDRLFKEWQRIHPGE